MPERILAGVLAGLCILAGAGCDGKGARSATSNQPQSKIVIPPHVKGTVAEYAALVGGGALPVQAHGIVVGLGVNGSAEVPAHLARKLEQYLLKQDLGSALAGTAAITPKRVLSDLDTSVVLVGGAVPPGAPAGTRFDLFVSTLPQTQTRSLDGGMLMPVDLTLAYGGVSHPTAQTQSWGVGGGQVFVNPFADPDKPEDLAKMRVGRIINGGKVTRDRQLRLQLRRAEYATADLIQRRINERFPGEYLPGDERMLPATRRTANAISRSSIVLRIPVEYRDDYEHFLRLVMHLPVHYGDGGPEAYARAISEAMLQPGARHDELALVWEAMGRSVLNVVQRLYASKNPAASFYAARTGLRLGDHLAAEVVMRHARTAGSPQRFPAIEELGRYRRLTEASPVLRAMLDDPGETVRIAAYEALLKRGDRTAVTRIDVDGQFRLDLVPSTQRYAVYATQTGEPKIVLFGRDMAVRRPVFFESPGELVTINAYETADPLTVFRKIPRTGGVSDALTVSPSVRSLVEMLGSRPKVDRDGNVSGLGLSYSQVVSVLYRLGEAGAIPGKLVLQKTPEMQRIYQDAATVGRPDMPGL